MHEPAQWLTYFTAKKTVKVAPLEPCDVTVLRNYHSTLRAKFAQQAQAQQAAGIRECGMTVDRGGGDGVGGAAAVSVGASPPSRRRSRSIDFGGSNAGADAGMAGAGGTEMPLSLQQFRPAFLLDVGMKMGLVEIIDRIAADLHIDANHLWIIAGQLIETVGQRCTSAARTRVYEINPMLKICAHELTLQDYIKQCNLSTGPSAQFVLFYKITPFRMPPLLPRASVSTPAAAVGPAAAAPSAAVPVQVGTVGQRGDRKLSSYREFPRADDPRRDIKSFDVLLTDHRLRVWRKKYLAHLLATEPERFPVSAKHFAADASSVCAGSTVECNKPDEAHAAAVEQVDGSAAADSDQDDAENEEMEPTCDVTGAKGSRGSRSSGGDAAPADSSATCTKRRRTRAAAEQNSSKLDGEGDAAMLPVSSSTSAGSTNSSRSSPMGVVHGSEMIDSQAQLSVLEQAFQMAQWPSSELVSGLDPLDPHRVYLQCSSALMIGDVCRQLRQAIGVPTNIADLMQRFPLPSPSALNCPPLPEGAMPLQEALNMMLVQDEQRAHALCNDKAAAVCSDLLQTAEQTRVSREMRATYSAEAEDAAVRTDPYERADAEILPDYPLLLYNLRRNEVNELLGCSRDACEMIMSWYVCTYLLAHCTYLLAH